MVGSTEWYCRGEGRGGVGGEMDVLQRLSTGVVIVVPPNM